MCENKNKEKQIIYDLLKWYKKNKRSLPWRSTNAEKLPDPYYVLVSEFMLQQTTVNTVKKRFEIFVSKWPNLDSLAKISNPTILKFWSGLGYYSRATNLLKAVKIIKKKFKSKIPNNYNDLILLPGIGEYTAKAILGIAFNKPTIPVDSNVERVLARIYGFQLPLKKIKNDIKKKSINFISKNSSTHLIQAFMDYGSIICTPRNPNCLQCMLKTKCISYKKNLQNIIPVKLESNKSKKKKYSRAYVFYNENSEILIRKRSSKGMLPSMLEVPNDKWVIDRDNLVHDKVANKFIKKLQTKGSIEYSFSHFDLHVEIFYKKVKKNYFANHKWLKKNDIDKSALPTIMKKILYQAL